MAMYTTSESSGVIRCLPFDRSVVRAAAMPIRTAPRRTVGIDVKACRLIGIDAVKNQSHDSQSRNHVN